MKEQFFSQQQEMMENFRIKLVVESKLVPLNAKKKQIWIYCKLNACMRPRTNKNVYVIPNREKYFFRPQSSSFLLRKN